MISITLFGGKMESRLAWNVSIKSFIAETNCAYDYSTYSMSNTLDLYLHLYLHCGIDTFKYVSKGTLSLMH